MTKAQLIVETGPQRGTQYTIDGSSVRIGRHPDSHVVLDDDAVTTHHARIDVRRNRYRIMDLGSLNGTRVNNVRVQMHELHDGDHVQLGRVRLRFVIPDTDRRLTTEPGIDTADASLLVRGYGTGTPAPRDPRRLAAAHGHLRVILELSEQLAMFYDVDEVLQRGVDVCVKSFAPDRVLFLLREEEGGPLRPRAVHTSGAAPIISASILQQVVEERQAIRVVDALEDDRFRQYDSVASEQIRSVLCVPLRTEAGVVGACYMDRVSSDAPFEAEQLQLAALVANVLGQRLEHIRLYRETLEVETLKVLNREMAETNEKLRDLERFKVDMVNMLVHDMKAPVATTLMSLDVISLDPEERLSDQAKDYLAVAKRHQRRLNEMIMNLLELSRLEEGRLSPQVTDIAMEDLLRRFLEAVGPYAVGAKIKLEVHMDADLRLESDPLLVERMLQNLVFNAINHSPEGSTVTIRGSERDDMVHLGVEDQGEGIPAELHERIFEKFAQAEVREFGLKSDVGLGLAFCRLAAESLGGRILVESAPGRGSTFTIVLPRRAAHTT